MTTLVPRKIVGVEVESFGSPPDIDTDFAPSIRDEVYRYALRTYGQDKVADIGTNGLFKAKSALKDVMRVHGVPPAEQNRITKLIPDPIDGKDPAVEDLFDESSIFYASAKDFREAVNRPEWREYLELAAKLQGRLRSVSPHPCGIIISGSPIARAIPLAEDSKTGHRVTRWDAGACEARGFLKIDMLNLETIDLTLNTLQYAKLMGKPLVNMDEMIQGPMDDPKVYALFQEGRSSGIFQFSSEGMRKLLRSIKPTCFDDLVAAVALYRPGPMEMGAHEHYAARKNGVEPITPLHPSLAGTVVDTILSSTYGLCIYQEQISTIASLVAGMDTTQADRFRKAMGKKKKSVMEAMYPLFMEGGLANGFTREGLQALWDMIEPFAKYAFNKSHSVAYAMNSYQAAYLKVYYPTESMAAFIAQAEKKDAESVKRFLIPLVQEAKQRMGLQLVGGGVNTAQVNSSPLEEGVIQTGFSTCKGIGVELAKTIIGERETNGAFLSVQDFVRRMNRDGKLVNKRVLVTLAKAGMFDCLGVSRKLIVDHADTIITHKPVSDLDLLLSDDTHEVVLKGEDWGQRERIFAELEVLPVAVSGHPMERWPVTPVDPLSISRLIASVVAINVKTSKDGRSFGSMVLDDMTNTFEVRLNDEAITNIQAYEATCRIEESVARGQFPDSRLIETAVRLEGQPLRALQIVSAELKMDIRTEKYQLVNVHPVYLGENNLPAVRVRIPAQITREVFIHWLQQFCGTYPGPYMVHAASLQATPEGGLSIINRRHRYQMLSDHAETVQAGERAVKQAKRALEQAQRQEASRDMLSGESAVDMTPYHAAVKDSEISLREAKAAFEYAAKQTWYSPVTVEPGLAESFRSWVEGQQYQSTGLSTSEPGILVDLVQRWFGRGTADTFLVQL